MDTVRSHKMGKISSDKMRKGEPRKGTEKFCWRKRDCISDAKHAKTDSARQAKIAS